MHAAKNDNEWSKILLNKIDSGLKRLRQNILRGFAIVTATALVLINVI